MKRNLFLILGLTGCLLLQSCSLKPPARPDPGTAVAAADAGSDLSLSFDAFNQAGTLVKNSDVYSGYAAEVLSCLTAMPDRYAGSETNQEAAEYIAGQMEQLGLLPFDGESYFSPYLQNVDGGERTLHNVVGYIKGSGDAKTEAVLITCHFDTVRNTPGAVDNASGTAAMLCTARLLSDMAVDSRPDIIFCAFNGEEQFYIGSRAFANEYCDRYQSLYNINYDCVGMTYGGAYMTGAAEDDISYDLISGAAACLENRGIKQNDNMNRDIRSDHVSFLENGVPAVCFSMSDVMSVIHSPWDTREVVDAGAVAGLAAAVTDFLTWEWDAGAAQCQPAAEG